MTTRIVKTGSMKISFGYGASAVDLKAFFSEVPSEAKVVVDHYKGDQRDPSYTTITATWEIK